MLDVIQLVKEGKGHFEWSELVSTHKGNTLYIKVFRDAMRFDGMPVLDWHRNPIDSSKKFDGVRLPASAYELQQIADLLNCMMLTPKVIDMIWLQAKVKFDAIVSVRGRIVANSNITDLHLKIEEAVKAKDDGKKLISCVGKYWCLINDLALGYYQGDGTSLLYGKRTSCNYGWFAAVASGPGLTPGTQCWQRPGFKHDDSHFDPSQTIRLMHRRAKLITKNGEEKTVDLKDIAQDPELCHLISHEGPLLYLRQSAVEPLDPLPEAEPIEEVKEPEVPSEPAPEPELEPEKEPAQIHDLVDEKVKVSIKPIKLNFIQILINFLRKLFKN